MESASTTTATNQGKQQQSAGNEDDNFEAGFVMNLHAVEATHASTLAISSLHLLSDWKMRNPATGSGLSQSTYFGGENRLLSLLYSLRAPVAQLDRASASGAE